jgi:hypothetical protein
MAGPGMTFKLAINVPIRMRVKYADEVEGQYGPQLRLKGEIEGEEGVRAVYVPIICANALLEEGATRGGNEKGAFYKGWRDADGWWTVIKEQKPGEKSPTTLLARGNAPVAAPKPAGSPPAAPAPDRGAQGQPEPKKPVTAAGRDTELVGLFADSLTRVLKFCELHNDKASVTDGIQLTGEHAASLTATLFIARAKLI